jgi:enterochelin esterase-like enzyme
VRRLGPLLIAAAIVAAGCGNKARVPPQRDDPTAAPTKTASAAHVVDGSFYSQSIRGTEHYAVYLPPGYQTSQRRYPVIYALHGLPSGVNGYSRMPIASWGGDAVRAGRPAIVVAPQGARGNDTDPEWHDWGPGRDWESVVTDDVVEQVDHTYRTIANRRGRALIGMSAGGYGATLIALHHPEEFSVIQSWSGYFHPTNPSGTAPLDVGTNVGNAQASAHTYVPLVQELYRHYRPTYFGFFIGDADTRFLAENRQLNEELDDAKIPHRFAVYQGAHTGDFWASHEADWIGLAVHQLAMG